jgi:hypothetical protein
MTDIRCIGICTGGGDAPGLNAVIRAAVKSAILKYKWKVIGIPDGFDGLIWPERSRQLTLADVSGILPRGGTILGTTNRGNPFHYKTIENGEEVVRDISDQVIANARALGIDAIITIGGDGSQKIGLDLFRKGMNLVGVPKTIDNDLCATDELSVSTPPCKPPLMPLIRFTPPPNPITASWQSRSWAGMRHGSPSRPVSPAERTSSSFPKYLFLSRKSATTWRRVKGTESTSPSS